MQKQESDLITAAARCELLLDQLDLLRVFADEARGSGSVDKASLGAFCHRINNMMQVAGLGAVVVSPLAMISNFGSDSNLGIFGSREGQKAANKAIIKRVDHAELPSRQPRVMSCRVVPGDFMFVLELTGPSGILDRKDIFLQRNDSAGNSSTRLSFQEIDDAVEFYEVIDRFVSSWKQYISFVPLARTLCNGNELEFLSDYRVKSRLGSENIDTSARGRIVVAAPAKSRTTKKKTAKTTAKHSITMHDVSINDSNAYLEPIAKIGRTYTYDAVDLAEFISANPVFCPHRGK